jgi:hypothetical protein
MTTFLQGASRCKVVISSAIMHVEVFQTAHYVLPDLAAMNSDSGVCV